MRDRALLRAFMETPWAILPAKLEQMRAVIELHAEGVRLSKREIEERIGGAPPPKPMPSRSGAVAVVPVFGVISQRMNMLAEMSGGTSTEVLGRQIAQLVADPGVKAIVLNIDSPGGSVFGVTELAAQIRAARAEKKIVAVANSMAASAAYNIAAQATEVVMTPSGLVGSIGVLMEHQDHSAALEQEGIKPTLIHAGKYKVEGNWYEPLSEEAAAALQAMCEDYYVSFVGDVAAGRGVSRAKVRSDFGQGRVMTADNALKAGLVDRVASLEQVITKLGGGPMAEAVPLEPVAEAVEIAAELADHYETEAAQAAEKNAAARRRWLELESFRH